MLEEDELLLELEGTDGIEELELSLDVVAQLDPRSAAAQNVRSSVGIWGGSRMAMPFCLEACQLEKSLK